MTLIHQIICEVQLEIPVLVHLILQCTEYQPCYCFQRHVCCFEHIWRRLVVVFLPVPTHDHAVLLDCLILSFWQSYSIHTFVQSCWGFELKQKKMMQDLIAPIFAGCFFFFLQKVYSAYINHFLSWKAIFLVVMVMKLQDYVLPFRSIMSCTFLFIVNFGCGYGSTSTPSGKMLVSSIIHKYHKMTKYMAHLKDID